MGQIDPQYVICTLIILFFAIGIHEYAHCKLADAAGDPTPRYYGRVTLNLFKHFDPVGVMMIIVTTLSGYGIGWGRPAPMDPRKMRNPRWDFFAAVAAGPISNFLQATVFAIIIRIVLSMHRLDLFASAPATPDGDIQLTFLGTLIFQGLTVNLSLMFFNLIPLGPLDGHWLLGLFLPEKPRYYWYRWNLSMGTYILFGLIFLGQYFGRGFLHTVLDPAVRGTSHFLTGIGLN